MAFIGEIQKTVAQAKAESQLAALADKVESAANRLVEIFAHMGKLATSADFKVAFAHSLPFLHATGDVIMAWMLLWRAVTASEQLKREAKKRDVAFYRGQISTADFFIQNRARNHHGKIQCHPERLPGCYRYRGGWIWRIVKNSGMV